MDGNVVQITKQGQDELAAELLQLREMKRPEAVKRVAKAREFGDLSENSEYHAAREDLNFIDGRIEELENILNRSRVVDGGKSDGRVGIGCQVTVETDGIRQVFMVVGGWEANPAEKKISHDSPLGKALIGKRTGEKVNVEAPAGTVVYKIKKIH